MSPCSNLVIEVGRYPLFTTLVKETTKGRIWLFRREDPRGHSTYPDIAIAQSVKWSKNVRDARNCPDQLLLASNDHNNCLFLGLVLWLEIHLHKHPEATYMMSPGKPEGKTKKAHKKFTSSISKTYRNQWTRFVLKNREFRAIYKGNDKRPLGLHSKRKMGSTQAKKRGAGRDQVDHRGRWVQKKGSQIVNKVYIDPEDLYANALCASVLALGGPIKYKLKKGLEGCITVAWLADHVVPNIGRRFAEDQSLLSLLGLSMLWLARDEQASEDLRMPEEVKERIKLAYEDLALPNLPHQPVQKVPLHVYRHGEDTIIQEILPVRQEEQQPQQQQLNVGDELARMPATEGAPNQHILQTLVIQQRNMMQQMEEIKQAMSTNDQRNRAWLEGQFRTLNNNMKRFGGTIQGGFVRQDPRRQAALTRANNEVPVLQPNGTTRIRGRAWPTLAPNVRDLMGLWTEYEYGIGGRKAAKDWTSVERGAGGNTKVKQMYHRRRNIWRLQKKVC
jgi:hypothetical protein